MTSDASGERRREWRVEIEQDGPRYRWVLMCDDRRAAKGAKWWPSEDEAEGDYDDFADQLRAMDEKP